MRESLPDPSPFVIRSLRAIAGLVKPGARALDVAMGVGRHAVLLAQSGFTVFGVDRDHSRLRRTTARPVADGMRARVWVADLETCSLPSSSFDLVLCTRYLQRNLWEALRDAVQPMGFILYETFTVSQRRYGWGPCSTDYLLRTGGELRAAFHDWEIWCYEESDSPPAEARLLARRPPGGEG